MSWLAIGGHHIGTMDSCLFVNVSFLSYTLTLPTSMNGYAELTATIGQ